MDVQALLDIPPWEWPPDAGQIFHGILTGHQAKESDRLIAADLAGNLVAIDDELAQLLLAITSDAGETEQLRAQAVISLGPILEQQSTDGFDDPDNIQISHATFQNIQDSLQNLFSDGQVPKEVRRRVLAASVRAPESWHRNAIQEAFSSGDRDWMLTAVFAMRWVRGFDAQILAALKSADSEIHYEAVHAAGVWSIDAAWAHVIALVKKKGTAKELLLAAVEAAGGIRPREAARILSDLPTPKDEDVAEAIDDVIAMAQYSSDEID